MPKIIENKNLKSLNTFGIEVTGKYYVEINSEAEFIELSKEPIYKSSEKLIIGGGSNLLFTRNFDGIVIKNQIKGIEIIKQDSESVYIKVGAGEVWHDLVMWCIKNNYAGLENLSLIPGCVGA